MIWIDRLFPTREGGATGTANERQMLERVNDTNSFRTEVRNTADGEVRLRTRGGFPEFVLTPEDAPPALGLRGFVVSSTIHSVLLTNSGIGIQKIDYTPYKHAYLTSPFASTVNLAGTGSTHWKDVASLYGGSLYINGELRYKADGGLYGIPVVLSPSSGAYDALLGGTTRPLAIVKTDKVAMVGLDGQDSISASLLGPTESISKSVKLGPVITHGTTTATVNLAKVAYTGSYWSDSGTWHGSWANIAVVRAAPYVTQNASGTVDLEAGLCNPTVLSWTPVSFSGAAEDFPVLMGESGPKLIYVQGDYGVSFRPFYVQPEYGHIVGTKNTSGSDTVYHGEATWTATGSYYNTTATDVTVSQTTGVIYRDRTEGYSVHTVMSRPVTGTLVAGGPVRPGAVPQYTPIGVVSGQNGIEDIGAATDSGTEGNYKSTEQIDSASIALSGAPNTLLQYDFTYTDNWGTRSGMYPKQTWGGGGWDLSGDASNFWYGADGIGVEEFAAWVTPTAANASALTVMSYFGQYDFTAYTSSRIGFETVNVSPYQRTADLSITTRDYLYFDLAENVFIYAKGVFSGSAGGGDSDQLMSMTVSIVLHVRGTEYSVPYFSITSLFMPLNYKLLDGVVRYIPLPQFRGLHAPLYCNQGACRAVAFTTLAEESAGASHRLLLDLNLSLASYDEFGIEPASPTADVSFIPYQLLEMLYAWVYSDRYGRDEFERYPVNCPGNFNRVHPLLFGKRVRITFDGSTLRAWPGDLGAPYSTVNSVEITRT